MGIAFNVEAYSQFVPECKELIRLHWEEIAILKDKIPLDVDYVKYKELEKQNILHVITVRSRGELVGYHIALITPHLHYKSTLMAITDIMFLKREYRRGSTGIELLKFFEQEMRKLGVKKIIGGTKIHTDIGPLFERLGWTATDRMYTKWIGD